MKEIMELIELNGITIVMDETKVLSDEIINSIYAASSQEYKGKYFRILRVGSLAERITEAINCYKNSL